ncbi:MAG: RNA polymerase sigma factor [Planctomycetota bacterium]
MILVRSERSSPTGRLISDGETPEVAVPGVGAAAHSPAANDEMSATSNPRQALFDVFGACCDSLYRFIAVRVGGDQAVADDLMQQICVEAGRAGRLPRRDRIEPWLRGIARNLIRRHWRRARLERGLVPRADAELARRLAEAIDTQPLPREWLSQKETRDQLVLAVTELMASEQEIIYRFYFAGESYEQIARTLEISVRSVEGRLYRIRAELRRKLAHLEDA